MRSFFRTNVFLCGIIIGLVCMIGFILNRDCTFNNNSDVANNGGGAGQNFIYGRNPIVVAPMDDDVLSPNRDRPNIHPGAGGPDVGAKVEGKSARSRSMQRIVAYEDHDATQGKEYTYTIESPMIFIGGVPRSGTTLMRAMMDAHPDVRCGEETRVIPRILAMRANWKNSAKEWARLQNAGLDDHVIDAAVSSFILEVITRHGKPAPRLCNKDPFTIKSTEYLSRLFPQSKFILMLRDGRAVVNSIISRKVTITGFDLNNPRKCLEKWNQAITTMYHQCYLVGEKRCFPMYYEQLVLHPKEQMQALLKFLDIPWNDAVLHHEQFIGKEISLSKTERSTDQVIKPVNLDALTSWVGKYPSDVIDDMAQIAPMLAHLGYDPSQNPPNYGQADASVVKNTNDVHSNGNYWQVQMEKLFGSEGSPPPGLDIKPAEEVEKGDKAVKGGDNFEYAPGGGGVGADAAGLKQHR